MNDALDAAKLTDPRRGTGGGRQGRPAPTPPTRSQCAAARPACRCGSARSRARMHRKATTSRCASSSASKVASVSATAASDPTALAERAVAMAKVSPEDPYQGLADRGLAGEDAFAISISSTPPRFPPNS